MILKDSLKTEVEDEFELLECLINITNKNIKECAYLSSGVYEEIEVDAPDGIGKITEESVCNIDSRCWNLDAVMDRIKNQLWRSTFLTYINSVEELLIKIAIQEHGYEKCDRNDFDECIQLLFKDSPDKIYFDTLRILRNNIAHSNCFEKHIGKVKTESPVFECNEQFPSIKFREENIEIYKGERKDSKIKDEVIIEYSFLKEVHQKLKSPCIELVKNT
ncbi:MULTISPECIES: hypothetical protein [unclassified Pseudoalteromonas]|uniref:hypothetical protein n=1 Tax=unclassified Pseudoalteromonas TaxID=194690 RepID=UPI000975D875|nr:MULTISPECIES: hypothetical protein [unclassified Pseudoalteromonas]MDN3487579.1 hypothetical protein [Pseudoalteromonas sp. APC 3694]